MKTKKLLGAHLSISKGIFTLQKSMKSINANTCAFFLKNQRTYTSPPIKEDDMKKFKLQVLEPEILLPHGSYLINLANTELYPKMYECLVDDLKRCELLNIKYYNIHPGSNTQKDKPKSISNVIETINKVHQKYNTTIVIENMAGQGNTLCSTFEEINEIIQNIYRKEQIGVCLDTCHLFGAGYDIRDEKSYMKTFDDFDRIVGFKYLKGVHLNDSKTKLNSKRDRHENLGKGYIGWNAFKMMMNDSRFDNVPMILETPNTELYGEEIRMLRSFENKSE